MQAPSSHGLIRHQKYNCNGDRLDYNFSHCTDHLTGHKCETTWLILSIGSPNKVYPTFLVSKMIKRALLFSWQCFDLTVHNLHGNNLHWALNCLLVWKTSFLGCPCKISQLNIFLVSCCEITIRFQSWIILYSSYISHILTLDGFVTCESRVQYISGQTVGTCRISVWICVGKETSNLKPTKSSNHTLLLTVDFSPHACTHWHTLTQAKKALRALLRGEVSFCHILLFSICLSL